MVRTVIILHLTLLWTRIISSDVEQYTINKCCPENEILQATTEGLFCAQNRSKESKGTFNVSVDNYSWFPIDAIVNSTTLKIHLNDTNKYLEILEENYRIKAGFLLDCGKNNPEQVAVFKEGEMEYFNLILFGNNSLKIYLSSLGNLRMRAKNVLFNKTINGEEGVSSIKIDSLQTFPLDNTCIDMGDFDGATIYFLRYCPCQLTTCIRKCCDDGEFMNATTNNCENITSITNMKDWEPSKKEKLSHYYLLMPALPDCGEAIRFILKKPDKDQLCTNKDNEFSIYANGSAKVNKYKKPYLPEHYCGIATWHEGGIIYEQNLLVCSRNKNPNQSSEKALRSVLYGTLLIIGGICLLITVSVSFFLPELKKRTHNKIALNHNFSLMVAYFSTGIVQLSDQKPGSKSCLILGLVTQFSFLGSFFWLNVMCIDISMTFSATRSISDKASSTKKLIYYSMYSWGTPSIISIVTIIMEFLPQVPYNILKPKVSCNCGPNSVTNAILYYFYVPVAFTLGFNVVLFIFTMVKIMKVQRQTAILQKSDSNATGGASSQNDKQRLILYAKLFLLMGLTWVTEIASWAVGGEDYYWYFSDVINLLRAVFIFILFICKKPVLRSLKRKLNGESVSWTTRTESSVSSTRASGRLSNVRFSTNSRHEKRKNLVMMNLDNKRKQLVEELSSSNLHKRRETQN